MDRCCFLIVDDQVGVALARGLRDLGDSVVALTYADAKQLLSSEQRFDAILMDVLLPDGSGLDLLAALRTSDWPNARVPVLVLTGNIDNHIANAAFDHGAYVIAKPFTSVRLRSFAVRACKRLRVENAIADAAARHGLTQSEREILAMAVDTMTRGAIAAARGISNNTLKHQTANLRAKTGDPSLEMAVIRLLHAALEDT